MDYAPRPKHLRQQGTTGPTPRKPARSKAPSSSEVMNRLRAIIAKIAAVWKFLRAHSKISVPAGVVLVALLAWAGGNYWWKEMRWRYILIHHTASDIGNMDYYRKFHVEKRGWSDIAYHFVVNNGSMNTTIGEIEESELWKERKPNLSSRSWYANYFGIAVVLVGNFERHPPPALQQEALIKLLTNLALRYESPPERIVGHREIQNTACPGKHIEMNRVRAAVAENLRVAADTD